MHWQEDNTAQKEPLASDAVVDVSFKVDCPQLPLDHNFLLKQTLTKALGWLAKEPLAAIHDIHGSASGNGWIRPTEHDAILHLSQRTRLRIRIPKERIGDLQTLENSTHAVGDYPLKLKQSQVVLLSPHKTLLMRYCPLSAPDEDALLEQVAAWCRQHRIEIPRMMVGQTTPIHTPDGVLTTHSVMLDGMDPPASLWLQEHGLGEQKLLGCGIFIPSKSIHAVYQTKETS